MNYTNFAEFIKDKREKMNPKIGQREFGRRLGVSSTYASQIENGNSPAPSKEILKNIVQILDLSYPEEEFMYNLAAKSQPYAAVPEDLVKYITSNDLVRDFVHAMKNLNVTDKELKEIAEAVFQKRHQQYEKKTNFHHSKNRT